MDGLKRLNDLPAPQARAAFERCCGSTRWVQGMVNARPFASREHVLLAARDVWARLGPGDWREAFAHHPRIGDKEALRARFAATREWAAAEQAGTSTASEALLDALARANREYETRFGHIFIVCATGKSAADMLALLRQRQENDDATELSAAAAEQAKITALRLEKLLDQSE